MSDMKKKYNEEVVPALTKSQGYKNVMQVPKLKKIVISMGIGTKMEKDAFTEAKNILTAIAGQLPVVTKARKNVANFKLRAGMPVGLMVTLRGNIMYEFLDRLVHNALPASETSAAFRKRDSTTSATTIWVCPMCPSLLKWILTSSNIRSDSISQWLPARRLMQRPKSSFLCWKSRSLVNRRFITWLRKVLLPSRNALRSFLPELIIAARHAVGRELIYVNSNFAESASERWPSAVRSPEW